MGDRVDDASAAGLLRNAVAVPDVGAMLDALLSGIREALGPNLVGVYLRGSLALGDFDPSTSDIDFLAVTECPVSDAEFAALAEMHTRLTGLPNRYVRRLEGSYIDRVALRRFAPGQRRHPTVGVDWDFGWAEHRDNWVLERWAVRECAVSLLGPDPKDLIDPIPPDELREAVQGELAARLRGWAAEPIGPDWLLPRYYQAFEVETMCRALYTLAHGDLPSKPRAVAWALGALPVPWQSLVEQSQVWRADETADATTLPEVLRFVRWAATEGTEFVGHPQEAGAAP